MSCEEIGSRIKDLREKAGLTQADLAKEMHVSREAVNQWERGARDLKSGTIIELAEFFHVSCDYILTGTEAHNTDLLRDLCLKNEAAEYLRSLATLTHTTDYIPGDTEEALMRLRTVNRLLADQGGQDFLFTLSSFLFSDFSNVVASIGKGEQYQTVDVNTIEIPVPGLDFAFVAKPTDLQLAFLQSLQWKAQQWKKEIEKDAPHP